MHTDAGVSDRLKVSLKIRNLHSLLGLLMLIPFVGWALTGLVFLIKPGYKDAYEIVQVKNYPLDKELTVKPLSEWLEMRYLKTVIGEHLLVKTANGWLHLDPKTLQTRSIASAEEIKRLAEDAFSKNPQRYGKIVAIENRRIVTDSGVTVTIDWETLTFSQTGQDTKIIDTLYRIHYLQWTGFKLFDKLLSVTAISLLLLLNILGIYLLLEKRKYL